MPAFRPPRALRRAPLLREPLRRLAKRLAPKGPVAATVDGLAFALWPADNKTEFDLWYKERLPERAELDFLAQRLGPGDLFVDIGANVGLYTVALLARRPGLTAVAFEPIERLRHRMARNLALNGVADRAELRPEAIGPHGSLALNESSNAGRSSLVPFPGSRGGPVVAVRPLATLLARPPAAVKIDVEGFEAEALMPYFDETSPAQWPRVIVLETLHRALWRRDCLQELFQLGYVRAGETAENALLARVPDAKR